MAMQRQLPRQGAVTDPRVTGLQLMDMIAGQDQVGETEEGRRIDDTNLTKRDIPVEISKAFRFLDTLAFNTQGTNVKRRNFDGFNQSAPVTLKRTAKIEERCCLFRWSHSCIGINMNSICSFHWKCMCIVYINVRGIEWRIDSVSEVDDIVGIYDRVIPNVAALFPMIGMSLDKYIKTTGDSGETVTLTMCQDSIGSWIERMYANSDALFTGLTPEQETRMNETPAELERMGTALRRMIFPRTTEENTITELWVEQMKPIEHNVYRDMRFPVIHYHPVERISYDMFTIFEVPFLLLAKSSNPTRVISGTLFTTFPFQEDKRASAFCCAPVHSAPNSKALVESASSHEAASRDVPSKFVYTAVSLLAQSFDRVTDSVISITQGGTVICMRLCL